MADCPLGAKCEEVKLDQSKPVLYRCPWYVRVRGMDTNTGEETDSWHCAIAWMPTLMINTANESRKGTAAVESFRNEVAGQRAQAQQALGQELLAAAQRTGQRQVEWQEEDGKCA
ncbi:MAG TPA: hypothetical protein VHB01_09250 [Nitrosospira sp.]|nr:hypothetical protein [Nitrosospira sp.]